MKYQNNEKKIMIMAEVKKDPRKKFFVLIITGKKKVQCRISDYNFSKFWFSRNNNTRNMRGSGLF